jgi:hypothetical protein
MPSEPRYWGTKQGKIVKAIAVGSIHSWRGLQTATQFTERELNYTLMLLFNDDVLKKSDQQYYLISSLEVEYKEYFYPKPTSPSNSQKTPIKQLIQSMKDRPHTFIKREILVMGIIIILISVSAFNYLNSANDKLTTNSGSSPSE